MPHNPHDTTALSDPDATPYAVLREQLRWLVDVLERGAASDTPAVSVGRWRCDDLLDPHYGHEVGTTFESGAVFAYIPDDNPCRLEAEVTFMDGGPFRLSELARDLPNLFAILLHPRFLRSSTSPGS